MKIRIEFEIDTDKGESNYWRTTRVWLDGQNSNSRVQRAVFEHQAGCFPKIKLYLLKHADGQPYVNIDKTDAAKQVIEYDGTLRIVDKD